MKFRQFLFLITPSVIVMFGFMLIPLYRTVRWSFEKVSYGEPGEGVGLANYAAALSDLRLGRALVFTVGVTVVVTVFCLVTGYLLAVLINGLGKMRPIVLGILLIPYVLPHVVGAVAYSWMFDTNFGGVINFLMNGLTGGAFGEPLWFTSAWPNRLIVVTNVIWFMLPFAMLMMLAGLQGVSQESLEAAEIDGASTLQRHLHVIIPSIRGVIGFVVLIFTMDVVRLFDSLIPLSPQATTLGNESIMYYVFRVAFADGAQNLGLGSAINILTILLILVLLYPSIRGVIKEARAA
ncbi:MAG TPA: sugar ABC transporter permease [Propionibacteriaceae bacterium]|nr:sugar ABC transporter permease [Propionibacteriaceae bacterium]